MDKKTIVVACLKECIIIHYIQKQCLKKQRLTFTLNRSYQIDIGCQVGFGNFIQVKLNITREDKNLISSTSVYLNVHCFLLENKLPGVAVISMEEGCS